MSKHSPEPWNVLVRPFVDDANGKTLCMPQSEGEMRIFDAFLMAAAPDLLKALKTMRERYGRNRPCSDPECLICKDEFAIAEAADAAIAKAEGGSQ